MNNRDTSLIHFHGLDTLRALAIALVMLYHFMIQGLLPAVLEPVARVGWIGVDLFFVLSGFLIGSQLMRPWLEGQRASLRDFYTRRAYRILPAFLAVMALYARVAMWREAQGPVAPWQYVTFLWNLLLIGYPEHRAFSHVWSLCVEEHFYLVFPLLTLALMRKPSVKRTALVMLAVVTGGIALRAWLLYHVVRPAGDEAGVLMMKYLYYPTYSRLDGLLAGVALATMRIFRPGWFDRLARQANLLCLAGVAIVLLALAMCGFDYISPELPASVLFAFPALALGFGLLTASAVCNSSILGRRVPGAATIATLAFSLYLTHKSVAHATHGLLPRLTSEADWRSLAIYLTACVGVATLLYFGVERPFIRLRTRGAASARQMDAEAQLDPGI